jgi:hypothetical protein
MTTSMMVPMDDHVTNMVMEVVYAQDGDPEPDGLRML